MENNMFAAIAQADAIYRDKNAYKNMKKKDMKDSNDKDDRSKHSSREGEAKANASNDKLSVEPPLPAFSNTVFHFVVSVVSAEKLKKPEGTVLAISSYYIAYNIAFLRIQDGESHMVSRRFHDIAAYYGDLVAAGTVSGDLPFPHKVLYGLLGSSTDPNSQVIRERKQSLQIFLRQLFSKNLNLFADSKTIEFFELTSFTNYDPRGRFISAMSVGGATNASP